jgi:hypothetical protein
MMENGRGLEMENQNAVWKGAMLACLLVLLVFLAGCPAQQSAPANTTPPSPTPPAPQPAVNNTPAQPPAPTCSDKNCFIAAANGCKDISMALSEDVGVFNYTSSENCTFTKTLVSIDASETQDMRNLLGGKSMACNYEKGKFDGRLVTSLIYGMEFCEGDLKEALAGLLVFT